MFNCMLILIALVLGTCVSESLHAGYGISSSTVDNSESDYVVSVPDLTLPIDTDIGSSQLEAYKSIRNDDILQDGTTNRTSQLKWASLGLPQFIPTPDAYDNATRIFHTTHIGITAYIQMLTMKQREILAQTAQSQYGVNIAANQIVNFVLANFQCSLTMYDDSGNTSTLQGVVSNFRNFPLKMDFPARPSSIVRQMFTNLTQQDEEGLQFDCSMQSTGSNQTTKAVVAFDQQLSIYIPQKSAEINPCAANPCKNNGTCTKVNAMTYSCACIPGWTGPECSDDVNECLTNNGGCSSYATCTNSIGSFSCACNVGFQGNGVTCTDINECLNNSGRCDSNAVCRNTIGSFTCTCKDGFTGTGFICSDINECLTNNGDCDSHAVCINTIGSFTCTCKDGFNGTGFVCSDINECLNNNGGCDSHAVCGNTIGSFTCACKDGFTGNGIICSDINECLTNNGDCDSHAVCINTIGSFTCTCKDGFNGTGFVCSDINECLTNNGGCDSQAVCINTIGSFTCTCKDGFAGDGFTCIEINPCAVNPCQNRGTCTKLTSPKYSCDCIPGWTGQNCTNEVNPCAGNPCKNSGTCTKLSSTTYRCVCTRGYAGKDCNIQSAYVGCYSDQSDRDLPDETNFPDSNTPHVCIQNCIAKNFNYAAVQEGYRCFCGSKYGRYGPSSTCNMPCPGDSSLNCGGPMANAVYATGFPNLGCYADQNDRDLPDYSYLRDTNCPEACIKNCISKHFKYAGVQAYDSCYCGPRYGRYGPSSTCRTPCPGGWEQVCGGDMANSVYATGIPCSKWSQSNHVRQAGCDNGVLSSSLEDCQTKCINSDSCLSIDWVYTEPPRCRLCSTIGTTGYYKFCTHYDLSSRDCNSCSVCSNWSQPIVGKQQSGCIVGVTKSSVAECQVQCTKSPTCQSIDWIPSSTPKCYLCSQTGATVTKTGCTHYDLITKNSDNCDWH